MSYTASSARGAAYQASADGSAQLHPLQPYFAAAIGASADHHFFVDCDFRVRYANHAWLRALEITEAQALGKTLRELNCPEEEAARYEVDFAQVLRTTSPISGEVSVNTAGGMQSFAHTIAPVLSPHGDVEGIAVSRRNITHLVQARRSLQESEACYDAIYNTSLEYIGLLSPEGIVLTCNRASLDFAAMRREDVVGKHFADTPWFAYTPHAPESIRRAIALARTGQAVRKELTLNRPDADALVFDFSITPVFDRHRRVLHLVPEGRDITELKRAEAALLQSEKLAAVGRLAASIAHEINNPLESVTNLIYLCQNGTSPSETSRYLHLAEQELRRVAVITNQTLRFHKQATLPQLTDGSRLFASVLRLYEGRLRNSTVQVAMRNRAHREILCFEDDMRQVLSNLLGNAIDAMPLGGRLQLRSRVAFDHRRRRTSLVLTIADNGTGLDPEARKRLFEPFFSTKGLNGTGLGLWISQEILARHQGRMRIRSSRRAQRSGTVVAIFLPFPDAAD